MRFGPEEDGGLVLVRTSVRAEVELGLATVTVRQEYHNPFDHPIDATYLFPLPPDAAVRGMALVAGDRRIEGEIVGRAEARRRYAAAASEGRRAALLEQERPNLFQQAVSGLQPGEDVMVELAYADPLGEDDGRRELVFPTTVGPRYRPGDVPEPPFAAGRAHAVDVEVVLDEDLAYSSVWSDSHPVTVDEPDALGRVVVRTTAEVQPNADFHLAWTSAAREDRVGTVVFPPTGGEDGYVGVTIEPGVVEDLGPAPARELLFVLDESCSMSGAPFEAEVAAVRLALRNLRPGDTFDLVSFADGASALFPEARPATRTNVAEAERWLQRFDGGGTEMTRGIVESLDLPRDRERLRLVLLLTDGFIGNEREVLDTVRAHLGDARLFSLGVGTSVNRYLLDELAREGRGDVSYQLPDTPLDETVRTFYARIAHPALTDLAIDWGGLDVTDVYPSQLPDLFAGQPIRVVARYHGSPPAGPVRVTGRVGSQRYAITRPLAPRDAPGDALKVVWARAAIADLERTLRDRPDEIEARVTDVALRHHLVGAYTSLVAEDDVLGAPGAPVEVPSLLPSGYGALAEQKRLESMDRLNGLLSKGVANESKAEMMLRLANLYYQQALALRAREGSGSHEGSQGWLDRAEKLYRGIQQSYPRYETEQVRQRLAELLAL